MPRCDQFGLFLCWQRSARIPSGTGTGIPLSAGQLLAAVSQGKPLAVPRPALFRVLLELSASGRAVRSGQPGAFLYRLPS
jgi:hypothetical protein